MRYADEVILALCIMIFALLARGLHSPELQAFVPQFVLAVFGILAGIVFLAVLLDMRARNQLSRSLFLLLIVGVSGAAMF